MLSLIAAASIAVDRAAYLDAITRFIAGCSRFFTLTQ